MAKKNELPNLPPLEAVLGAIESSEPLSQQESLKTGRRINCPILARKIGNGEVEIFSDWVACEFFDLRERYPYLKQFESGSLCRATPNGYSNFGKCPYYEAQNKK